MEAEIIIELDKIPPDLLKYFEPIEIDKFSIWTIPTRPFKGSHFAVFPLELCITPIKAGCPQGGVVLDPFAGAFTTCVVAKKLRRYWIGIELNPDYCKTAEKRINNVQGSLF